MSAVQHVVNIDHLRESKVRYFAWRAQLSVARHDLADRRRNPIHGVVCANQRHRRGDRQADDKDNATAVDHTPRRNFPNSLWRVS